MSFDENNFEKLRFDPFGFDNVLLNKTNAPNENIFHNLTQIDSVFYGFEEAATSLKKFNTKTFLCITLERKKSQSKLRIPQGTPDYQ